MGGCPAAQGEGDRESGISSGWGGRADGRSPRAEAADAARQGRAEEGRRAGPVGDSRVVVGRGGGALSLSVVPSPPSPHFPSLPLAIAHTPRAPRSPARPTHTRTCTHAMAGRDPDDVAPAPAPPAQRARPDDDPPAAPVYVCGLEVGLLDVGRVVALNGYPEACARLAFVSSSFYLERDLLMATKHVRYGRLKRTRLMSLSRKGDAERVSFLLKVGAEVGARDADGLTALHCASELGHEPLVRLLLDKGADVGARDRWGWTALHLAISEGHVAVAILLREAGATE